MKRCLKCNQTYTDENLNYCLSDGTALTIESEQQTVVIQKSQMPKKSGLLLWLGLFGLIVLVGIGVIGGLLIYKYSNRGESVRGERQNGANLSPSPTLKSTPRVTPTTAINSSVTESSPKNEEVKPSPTIEDTEEITPIAWDTTPSGFKGEVGQTYKFECPADGTVSSIWGSDVYTADSSICTVAVHAGLINLAGGGIVTVEYRPGRPTYGSTVRNGITSKTYGEYPRSFVVR